ncbi:alpha/beta fold hydrolase [Actinokineospora bangkokensis]|uniref:Alpha/beta hydrolase n=1 Tax=Actinokineospora bangkokensis TaxID=1193682 RepID=A0A1Q9LKX1_9PSEU|nr:alpha/beta fold hydrolase [Actinokineospora bangkokensis]OLR92629.1 alpha/beta hydrolase [Actinokineospora bangkokensis]
MELSREFAWRGRTVAWERVGTGPAVVLCHGTPWSSWLWSRFAEALGREHAVYVWDMPGYGKSSKDPDHPVDLGVQGELFADLLQHWGLDAPHVIAHDYGGAVSLRAALLHGAAYSSLALVDVVALRPWGSEFFRLVAANAEVFAALPPAVHRGALEAYIGTASHRGLRPDDLAELTGPWLTDEGQQAFYRQIAQADERFTADLEDHLHDLRIPVHIIWGDQDTWIPPDRAHRLAGAIPGATVEVIGGAGHLIHLDAPVELATALTRWLTRNT